MTQGILEFHKIPPNPPPTDVKQPADAKQKNAEILGSSPGMTQGLGILDGILDEIASAFQASQ